MADAGGELVQRLWGGEGGGEYNTWQRGTAEEVGGQEGGLPARICAAVQCSAVLQPGQEEDGGEDGQGERAACAQMACMHGTGRVAVRVHERACGQLSRAYLLCGGRSVARCHIHHTNTQHAQVLVAVRAPRRAAHACQSLERVSV